MKYNQQQFIYLFWIIIPIFDTVFSDVEYISSIDIYPQSTTIQDGNSHTLTCNITGDTTPDIFWYFNGQKIPGENSTYYNIASFSAGSEGRYHCVANNSFGKIVSSSINLNLAYFDVDRDLLPESTPIMSPNTSFLLQCPLNAVDSLPPPLVAWLLNSVLIQRLSYPLVLTLDGGGLVFSLVRSTDAGLYSCRVTNSLLNVYEDFQVAAISQLKQQTTRDAEFHATPIDRAASIGNNVSFQCIIGSSSSTPPVNWKFGDASLTLSERISFSQNSGRLKIRDVRQQDAGSYSCSDASGRLDPKPFALTVITPPEITENHSPLLEPLHSSNISLSCESEGTTPLNYSWFYNGDPIDRSRALFPGARHRIEIRSLLPSDDGVYQCFVRNSAGEDSRAFILSVQFQLPILITLQKNILAFVGQHFVFGCLATAAPTPIYTYTLDNLPLPSTGYTKLNATHYAIFGASKSHTGVYTCNISNSIGSDSQMFIIRIIDPTTPYSSMLRNLTSFSGETVTLACRGSPDTSYATLTLEYRWEHDGAPVSMGGRFQLTGNYGDLQISPVDSNDFGNYSCFAKTSDTSLTSTLYLETLIGYTILFLPSTPARPTGLVTSLNGSTVHISWILPINSSDGIGSYLVEYRVDSPQWSEAGNSTSDSLSFSSCPGLTYEFRVYAINIVGRSEASLSALIYIPQQVPSIVPVNVSVQPTEIPFNLHITWEIPIPPSSVCTGLNGELIGHLIEYRSPHPSYTPTRSISTSYVLTGLTPFTSYRIRVAFTNNVGIGDYSDVGMGMTSEDRPSLPPSNFEIGSYGANRIAVYFTAPIKISRNERISGYKVTCQESSGENITTRLSENNASTLNILSNFRKNTQYYCNVLASNSKGDGPATVNETVFASELMVPSLPKSLMIIRNGSYQALFTYTPPDDIDDLILTLKYTYPLTPHVTREQSYEISGATNEHTLYNLDAGVEYAVKLAGRNEDGIGFNRTGELILPPGRPRAASIHQNKSSNIGNVAIIWSILHDGGSNITKTTLEQRFLSETDTTWIPIKTFSSFNTSYEMPIPDNPLQVRIVIQNIHGSAASTSVELNPLPDSQEFSSTIIIALVVVVLIFLGILVVIIVCAISYFSCRREHKKNFLDFRKDAKLSGDEESNIFRNLNEQTDEKKRTSFPLSSESSSDGAGTGGDNNPRPPSYHSNFPSKDSKVSTGSKSSKSSGSSRHKVEIAERKQEPISKGVLTQHGKVQSAKLAHKTVVFAEHQTQSSIDSDSTEPSQASWTNTFNRQVRDSPIPILEEPSPPLPPKRHGDQQPHPLSFTTNPRHNVHSLTNSDVWDSMHPDSLTNLQNPVHLTSHKKSRSDELSDHYSIRYDDPLDILPPAVAKLRGKQARNEQPARSKSPISYLAQKLSFSPTKAKDRSTPVPDETPDPHQNTSSPTFDENALADTIFSDSLRKPRVSHPVYPQHQQTDSNLSLPTSSQPSFC